MSMIGKDAEITLTDVTFRDNHALATKVGVGGAIHLQCPGIRFVYRVSEKKTIVNSGNTAVHGGFLHTHNGDVDLVFDVGNKGKLVIGKEGAKTDSIDLTRGTTFRKSGAGDKRGRGRDLYAAAGRDRHRAGRSRRRSVSVRRKRPDPDLVQQYDRFSKKNI